MRRLLPDIQIPDTLEPVSYTHLDVYKRQAMKWAVGNGIIEGKENEDNSWRLDPQGNTSRAECAIIIMRFWRNTKNK